MLYIVQQASTWYFRWRVGQMTLKISLATGNKRKAGLIARKLHRLMAREAEQNMDENRLRRALVQYRDALVRADDEKRWTVFHPFPGVPSEHLGSDEPYNTLHHEELVRAIQGKDIEFLSGLDNRFREITDIDIGSLPEAEQNKVRLLAGQELARVMGVQKLRMTGNYTIESIALAAMNGGIGQGQTSLTSAKKTSISLSAAITAWHSTLISEGKKKTTLAKYLASSNEFLEIIGDLDLIDIGKGHARTYREILKKLPSKYRQKFKGKTIKQVLDIEHSSDSLCSAVSINDKLNAVKQLMAWAVDNEYIDENPMEGIIVKEAKKRSKAAHAPYTMTDIASIFCQNYTKHTSSNAYHFWLPILALYTGARLGELAQLKVEDIEQKEGVWCIHIQPDEFDSESSVKTEAAIRIIPLHPFLTDTLRFPTYVEIRKTAGLDMVFDITPAKTGGYSKNASKWYNTTFLPKIPIEPAPAGHKKAFHSFRSTLATVLKRAKVPGRLAAQVIGHVPPAISTDWIEGHSMTYDYYAGGYSIADVFQGVTLKIDYGLNLSHLALSPWTGPCDFPPPTGTKKWPMAKGKK